jgi:myosin heavy subunit
VKLYQVAYELVGKLSSSFNTSMFSASESLQGLNNKLKDINSAQKNITGFAKLEEDARKTSVALSEARKKFAELNNEIKASGTPTKQQSQNLETARLKVENLSNKLGSQRQKLSEVRNELKNAGINYKNLSAENERLAQSTLKAQKAQEKLRNVLSKEQALNAKRSEMQGQIVGAAAVAFSLAQPIREAIAFESAMSDVRKTVDFDTPEQFAQMQQDILKMGRTLPLAHDGLAALVAAGGQAGLAREELAKFAEDAAKMATAFDKLSADEAGTMMANWRTAFKMSQDEVRALSDQINYLSNVTASDTTALADIVTRVGALGDVAGLSAASIVAVGTTMASVGVKSDVAATGIKNFMLSMVAGEAATKSQREDMKVEVTYIEPKSIEKVKNVFIKDLTCESLLKAYKELFNE